VSDSASDASNVGVGAVLSQKKGDGEQVVAYYSQALNWAQRNDCMTGAAGFGPGIAALPTICTGVGSSCAPTMPQSPGSSTFETLEAR